MKKHNKQHKTAAAAPEAPNEIKKREWLAIRKEAARKIDPDTAEVDWDYAQTLDPYRLHEKLPDSLTSIGREYFAYSSGADVWVLFEDLSEPVRDALWEKHAGQLAPYPTNKKVVVRTCNRPGAPLMVRTGDKDDALFVHVENEREDERKFEIFGWISGKDAKQFPLENPSGLKAAHFIPNEALSMDLDCPFK